MLPWSILAERNNYFYFLLTSRFNDSYNAEPSRPAVFCEKVVYKTFGKFAEKLLYRGLLLRLVILLNHKLFYRTPSGDSFLQKLCEKNIKIGGDGMRL